MRGEVGRSLQLALEGCRRNAVAVARSMCSPRSRDAREPIGRLPSGCVVTIARMPARSWNPIVQERDGHRTLELARWGYLINGAPAKFPSINTRSERLAERTGSLPTRAVVPATSWFEMQKPSRQWFQFDTRALELFAMAAVTQPGRAADGASFTCYSIIMRPATGALSAVHDRAPLLIPATFLTDWLTSDAPPREVVETAVAESERMLHDVTAEAIAKRP